MALNPQNIKGHEFKPGQSGNPKGRPPGIPNAKTRYMRLLSIITKANNPVTGEEEDFSQMELMDMKIMAKALKGDLAAYKEIMDRLEGRPAQDVKMEHSGNIDRKLSEEELDAIIARASKASKNNKAR